ncbi:MAG TPA: membrane protein insertase YidC [Verrucomicrobiae bacterium]|jgi:YidC/Oxa1 family membrane protein insertase
MDRKSIIIIIVAVALYFALSPVIDHFFPSKQMAVTAPPVPAKVASAPETSTNLSSNAPPAGPADAAVAARPESSAPEQILTISNADLIWHFTSRGGGLKEVELIHYPAVIRKPGTPKSETNLPASLNHNAPLPVMAVMGEKLQGDGDFTMSRQGDAVHFERTLASGLRVVKEFQVSSNYLFKASVQLENTTAQPLRVPDRDVIIGTATAAGALDDPSAMGAFWYNGLKSRKILDSWFANRTLGCIPGTPRWHDEEGASNVVWAAIHNQFFALAAIPSNAAPEVIIDKIRVLPPPLNGPTNSTSSYLTNGYQTALVYPMTVLAPHKSLETSFLVYAGPKEYKRLAEIGQAMGNNLDLIMDFTGMMGFFSKLLLWSMNELNELGLGYGLAIIAITVIIKVVFWPLTNASTKSQKRMQALQPQLKAIADKYKDDSGKRNEKTMEFYKQNKLNPMGGCVPMLIQLPVMYGFYYMMRGAIELRGAHFLWAFDLSQPDTVAVIAGFPINPMPLIMGATQLWQSHTMPPSPGMDPGQQKMMRWLPVMMIAIFYKMSAGLVLYWTVSNVLSILQMKVTRTASKAASINNIYNSLG